MITNPPAQRALRGHRPQRPTPRAAASGDHHAQLAGHLTARDRWLAHMLFEHRVFTTHQIVDLAWTGNLRRTANERLRKLFLWRVLDRFQPFIGVGVAPMHYVLDVAGAVALAYEHGLDPKDLHYRHEHAMGIAHSLRLAHTVGINQFFTSLIARGRQHAEAGELTAWWSEARCARLWGDIVRPDGYGRWREHDATTTTSIEVEFFLEFDFGTESLRILTAKLHDYHQLAISTGIVTPLLIWLPSAQREASARRALTEAHARLTNPELVPVATSNPSQPASSNDPAADCWLPITGSTASRRIRLVEFAKSWPFTAVADSSRTTITAASRALLPAPHPAPPSVQPSRPRRGAA